MYSPYSFDFCFASIPVTFDGICVHSSSALELQITKINLYKGILILFREFGDLWHIAIVNKVLGLNHGIVQSAC